VRVKTQILALETAMDLNAITPINYDAGQANGIRCSNTVGERCGMITARLPRSKALLDEFGRSDRITGLALPEDGRLVALAKSIEEAMLLEKDRS
jgi:hypothetical protein